ncbi:DUF3558 family protein [Amycolatopsis pithecellobii]|nr:DUF3558 family protein [Amycolatopsis pithecellobii]
MIKRKAAVPAVLLVLAGVAACSSPRTESPSPIGGPSSASTVTSESRPTGGGQLASVNACDLLTDQEAAQFNARGPGRSDSAGATGATSACQRSGRSADDSSTSFTVSVRAEQGLADVNADGGTLTSGSVNNRPATQVTGSVGATCLISLGVTKTSRVDISFVIGAGTEPTEACRTASQIANIVEPKLPKYEG